MHFVDFFLNKRIRDIYDVEIKDLDGTLKYRSDRAKQTLNNEHSDVNELEDYGTRKKLFVI